MNPMVLRKIWAAVDAAPSSSLLGLSDADLVKTVFDKVVSQTPLSHEEEKSVSTYLYSKTTLIRDLV